MIFDKLLTFLKIQKFSSQIQLLDGTLIQIDGVLGDKDVPVSLITSDGNIPLPDGEYPLAGDYEGSILIVENGIIVDIKKLNEDDEPDVDDTKTPETELKEPDVNDTTPDEEPTDEPTETGELSDLKTKINDIFDILEKMLKRIEVLEVGNVEDKEELSKMKEMFKKLDGAEPVKKNIKNNISSAVEVKSPYYNVIREKKK